MDAMRKFHFWGFKTSVLIGDGASPNLTMFKRLTGYSGIYGVNEALPDPHYIKPYFLNPFSGEKVFIVVCPSRMVCNTIIIIDYNNLLSYRSKM